MTSRAQRRAKVRRVQARAPLKRPKIDPPAREALTRAAARDWFILITKPQREANAQHVLAALGFDVYCPLEYRWRRAHWRHRSKRNHDGDPAPAYRGYLFIACPDWAQGLPWHLIEGVSFLSGYMSDRAGRPVRVRGADIAADMQATRRRVVTGAATPPSAAPICLKPGEHVRIHGGPLDGEAFIVRAIEGETAQLVRAADDTRALACPVQVLTKAA